MLKVARIRLLAIFTAISAVSGQGNLDASMYIIDQKSMAGEVGIYRFNTQTWGDYDTTMQTFLPASAKYQVDPAAAVSICRQVNFDDSVIVLSNCVYDAVQNMISFDVPSTGVPGFFAYELGSIKNPTYSTTLTGFSIRIVDKATGTQDKPNILLYETPALNMLSLYIVPNVISGQTVSASSQKVAENSIYTFAMDVFNEVAIGGTVQVDFPEDQFTVPATIPNPQININGAWSGATVIIADKSVSFVVPPPGISALSTIQLQMEIQNPNTMAVSQSFSVSTKTNENQIIDEVITGLTVQNTEPSEITVDQANFYVKTVGSSASYSIFKIVLPTTYASGGYLIITFPEEMTISSYQCQLNIGFEYQANACDSPSAQQIRITAMINAASLTFTIAGVTNPSNTKETGNFEFRAYDTYGNMIADNLDQVPATTFTPTPGYIKNVSVTRQDWTVGAKATSTTNQITIQLTAQNKVEPSSFLQITVPLEHFLLTGEDLFSTIVADGVALEDACIFGTSPPADSFIIECPLTCMNCGLNEAMQVVVKQGIQNLNWILPENLRQTSLSVSIITPDRLYTIDEVTTNVLPTPDLIEGGIDSNTLVKPTGMVYEPTEYLFSFQSENGVPNLGHIALDFKEHTILDAAVIGQTLVCYDETNQQLACYSNMYPSPNSEYIKTIMVTVQPIAKGASIQIKVTGVGNPKSVRPITNLFEVRTYTQELYAIDLGTITNAVDLSVTNQSLLAASLTAPVSPQQIVTGAKGTIELSVTLRHGIEQTYGRLEITVPVEMEIDQALASCLAFEPATMTSLTCTIISTSQIYVTNSQSSDYAGQPITVQIQNGVRFPQTSKPSSAFGFKSTLSDGSQYYLVEIDDTSVTLTANTANVLQNVSITRSVATVSYATELQICLETTNPVPSSSKLKIEVPEDQTILNNANRLESTKDTNEELSIISRVASSPYSTIIIEVGPFAAATRYCFNLKGTDALMNPATTASPTDSFKLTISTSDDYLTDGLSADLFAQPYLSAGPFTDPSASFSGPSVVNQLTTISVTVTPASPVPINGYFVLRLPAGVVYHDTSNPPTCAIDSYALAACASFETKVDQMGDYISLIKVKTPEEYEIGTAVSITFGNVLNRFSDKEMSTQKITVESLDENDYTVNESQIDLIMQSALTANSEAAVLSAHRSTSLIVQQTTVMQVQFQTKTRLLHQSYVIVGLSKEQVFEKEGVGLQCKVDGQTTVCALDTVLILQHTNFWHIKIQVDCTSHTGQVCPDQQVFTVDVTGFANRPSVFRDPALQEVFTFTFDPQLNAVDQSPLAFFSDELIPGEANVDLTMSTTQTTVSQETEFSLSTRLTSSEMVFLEDFRISVTFTQIAEYSALFQYSKTDNSLAYLPTGIESAVSDFVIDSIEAPTGYLGAVTFANPKSLSASTITTSISGVLNLQQVQPLKSMISASVYDKDMNLVAEQPVPTEINVEMLTPQTISQMKVTRITQSLDDETAVTIAVRARGLQLSDTSVITFYIPKAELVSTGGSGLCVHKTTAQCQAQENGDYVKLVIGDLCQTVNYECAKGTLEWLTFQVSGVFRNPAQYVINSTPVTASISNGDYLVANSNVDVHVEPALTVQNLPYVEVNQTGFTTGQNTTFNITLQLGEYITDKLTKLHLTFPDETILFDRNSSSAHNDPIITESKVLCENLHLKKQRWGTLQKAPVYLNSTFNGKEPFPMYATKVVMDLCDVIECYLLDANQTITVSQLYNVDHIRLREEEIYFKVSVVAGNDYVMAEAVLDEVINMTLNPLEELQFNKTHMNVTRSGIKIGQRHVNYDIEFRTLNPIAYKSFLQLSIPFGQANIVAYNSRLVCRNMNFPEDRIKCKIMGNSRKQDYQVVMIYDICSYHDHPCLADMVLHFQLVMDNPGFLASSEVGLPIILQAFTEEYFAIEQTEKVIFDNITQEKIGDNGVYATPPLEGFILQNMNVERTQNMLGVEFDTLRFFAPRGPPSRTTITNVRIDLPKYFAMWKQYGPQLSNTCYRTLTKPSNTQNGTMVTYEQRVKCKITKRTTREQVDLEERKWLPKSFFYIDQIEIEEICNWDRRCMMNEPLEFKIYVHNPHSNNFRDLWKKGIRLFFSKKADIVYDQIDLGQAFIPTDRQMSLLSNQLVARFVGKEPLDNNEGFCLTGSKCEVKLKVDISTSLVQGSKMEITLPKQLMLASEECYVQVYSEVHNVKCQTRDSQRVRLTLMSPKLDPKTEIFITLKQVQVPESTMPTDLLVTSTFEKIGRNWSPVDINTETEERFSLSHARPFDSISIKRSTTFAGEDVNLSIQAGIRNIDLTRLMRLALKQDPSSTVKVVMEVKLNKSSGTVLPAPYKCSTENDKEEIGCYSVGEEENGFYFEILSSTNTHRSLESSSSYPGCAENLEKPDGCQIQLREFKFRNALFAVNNFNRIIDSAIVTIGLQVDHNKYKVVESDEGLYVLPPLSVSQSLTVRMFNFTPRSTLGGHQVLRAGDEFNLYVEVQVDQKVHIDALQIQFLPLDESQADSFDVFYLVEDDTDSLQGAFNGAAKSTVRMYDTDLELKNPADKIEDSRVVEQLIMRNNFMTDLKDPQYLRYYGGLLFPSTTNQHMKKVARYVVRAIKLFDEDVNSIEALNVKKERHLIVGESLIQHQTMNVLPSKLHNLSFFVYKPFKGDTTTMLVNFSVQPRVYTSTLDPALIQLRFPPSVAIDNIACRDPTSKKFFVCTSVKDKDGIHTVFIKYIEQNYRTLNYTQTFLFQINGIVNLKNTTVGQIEVLVRRPMKQEAKNQLIHATGEMDYKIYLRGEHKCKGSCDECREDGSCISCHKPSQEPLLTYDSRCVDICPDGTYQYYDKCLQCAPLCLTCRSNGRNQCQSCVNGAIMIDGACYRRMYCPEGMGLNQVCYRNNFTPQLEAKHGKCEAGDKCAACGLKGNYCSICRLDYVQLDGECIKYCPKGFFSYEGICYQCSPECKSCSSHASDCTQCHKGPDALHGKSVLKIIHTPWSSRCVQECLPGEFKAEVTLKMTTEQVAQMDSTDSPSGLYKVESCFECGPQCNTCAKYADFCTSCYYDKLYDDTPLYFAGNGTCQRQCPWFHYKEDELHRCLPHNLTDYNFLMTSIILLVAPIVTTLIVIISRVMSKQTDKPGDIAVVSIQLFEFINKAILFVMLLQSRNYFLFCMTGVSLLGTSLIGVFFVQLILNPMLNVILRRQRYEVAMDAIDSELHVKTPKRCLLLFFLGLAQFTSPYVIVGFMTSKFLGKRELGMPLEKISPMFYVLYMQQATSGVLWLSGLQVFIGLNNVLFNDSLSVPIFGLCINCVLIGIVSMGFQLQLIKRLSNTLDRYYKMEEERRNPPIVAQLELQANEELNLMNDRSDEGDRSWESEEEHRDQ